uniref:Putative transcription factor hamlet n=1 Tax=Culex tarsalis TaxID=7177 RepID=A0A1Q3F945_CULTA
MDYVRIPEPVKQEPDITTTMTNFKQEPAEVQEDVKLHEEAEFKSYEPYEPKVVSKENGVTYEIIHIKQEPESISDNHLADEDIKQEIIELGEYELNDPAEDSKNGVIDSCDIESARETNVSNEPPKSKDFTIKQENPDSPPANKSKNSCPRKECEHCGKTFVYQYRLALHRIQKHGSTETPVANTPVRSTTLPRNFHCDQCDKSYHLQTNLDIHKVKVHGVGEAPPRKTEYVKHTCKHCKKQITGWTSLVYHLKFVHGESIDKSQFVKCTACLKKFASAEEMAEHLCLKGVSREKERPFKCDLCGKAYPAKIHLEGHYSIHPEYHNVKCDECPKGFFNERELNCHKRHIHKAEESYIECVTCNKRFKNQNTWRRHQETHGGRDYCCEQCGKKFKTRNSLKSHLRDIHTGRGDPEIACTLCGKTMKGKRVLQKHMQYHHNDQRFTCSFPSCGKTFIRGFSLKVHEQTHTKDYSFKCRFCEYGAVRRNLVVLHEQQKHSQLAEEDVP